MYRKADMTELLGRKIALLGATGFLGKRMSIRLKRDGVEYVPVSLSLGTDLRNKQSLQRVFDNNPGLDTIVNAATFIGGIRFGLDHPAEIFYNNSLMNANLFEVAHDNGIRRIVNPISNCSYPRDAYPEFLETAWWDGELDESVMVYGFVRKGSWISSWAYQKQYGLETISLIVPNMYGPGDHFDEVRSHALGALVMKIFEAKKRRSPSVVVWGSGKPVREWLYVDDCVEAVFRAIAIPYTAEPVNIGIGSGVTIAELAEMIRQEVGYEGKLVYDTSKPDGAPYKVMNVERCRRVLGWSAPTKLEEGLRETVRWYAERNEGR
jgi:GDP-L-fucose synthase